jgi:hypothetical protein
VTERSAVADRGSGQAVPQALSCWSPSRSNGVNITQERDGEQQRLLAAGGYVAVASQCTRFEACVKCE